MNSQQTHNALTNQKSSAAFFKVVKTEETISSQDQKLVETTNLWQLSSYKKITTAQIRFCNDRLSSRIDDWNNKEFIKTS